jgi:hypothetical protein
MTASSVAQESSDPGDGAVWPEQDEGEALPLPLWSSRGRLRIFRGVEKKSEIFECGNPTPKRLAFNWFIVA